MISRDVLTIFICFDRGGQDVNPIQISIRFFHINTRKVVDSPKPDGGLSNLPSTSSREFAAPSLSYGFFLLKKKNRYSIIIYYLNL